MTTNLNSSIPCIETNTALPAKGCVIWLHGLGADGNDFAPIVSELNLPNTLSLRFIFPHAPFRSITINQGSTMRAWFDVKTLKFNEHIDQQGIQESIKLVESLIEKERQLGIPTEKIILAGFSQGAIIALATALHYPKHLGGVLALSGCLPFVEKLLQTSNIAKTTSIFLAHGTEDPIVSYALDVATYEALKKHNLSVEWHSYPMGHGVSQLEIRDIAIWLERVFSRY